MEPKRRLSFYDFASPYVFRILDFSIVAAAFYVSFFIRFDKSNTGFGSVFEYQMLSLISSLMVVGSVSAFGVYVSWRGKYRIEMFGRLFIAWTAAFMILLTVLVLSKKGEDFSRLWIGYAYSISFIAAVIYRLILHNAIAMLRAKGINQKNVLMIGHKKLVQRMQSHISAEKGLGLQATILLDETLQGITEDSSYKDGKEGLEALIKKHAIHELWICLPLKEAEYIEELLFALRHSTVDIRYVPDMSGFRLLNHQVSDVAGISTIDLSFSPMDGASYFLKRAEDLVLALVIFILISPILLLTAIAIKLDSKGPILFKQLRHGADGKPINVYKFRTMKVHQEGGNKVSQATKDDDRITKIGAILRRTSLDEFPQFYNVLQGRMSVVGPRPHAMAHNEHYKELIESYMQRHKVKPGITGWAQINGYRGETDTIEKMEKRVEFDLYYIDNWSLFFDVKIVFISIFKGFISENAY